MFEVVALRRALLAKHVTFNALEGMAGTETLVSGGTNHALAAVKVPYEFPRGFTIELRYPFWASLSVGRKVQLRHVLRHPYVQRELFWKARQLRRGQWQLSTQCRL